MSHIHAPSTLKTTLLKQQTMRTFNSIFERCIHKKAMNLRMQPVQLAVMLALSGFMAASSFAQPASTDRTVDASACNTAGVAFKTPEGVFVDGLTSQNSNLPVSADLGLWGQSKGLPLGANILLSVSEVKAPADGRAVLQLGIKAYDAAGVLITTPVKLLVETNLGRLSVGGYAQQHAALEIVTSTGQACLNLVAPTVAGASSALLGLIEGLADFSASSLNYLAGWLSDRRGKRKGIVIAGYGFSTLAKTILLVSSSVVGLSLFRVIERLGKGFRGPPRDAWLSSVAGQANRGYAFGVHKALDKAGAVLGPLVAYGLLSWLGESASTYQTLFWVALVPAVISVVLLTRMKDQPGVPHERESIRQNWHALSPGFKRFLWPAGIFALAYFSLGFLLLKAHDTGFSVAQIVLLYALFNTTCVVVAPLVGKLGDRVGRSHIVVLGYALYGAINLGLMFATSQWEIIVAFAFYGFFYAIEDSQSKAFIADLEPERRATAVGAYNFVTGVLYLPASLVAGALWASSPRLAVALAAGLSLVAMGVFVAVKPVRIAV